LPLRWSTVSPERARATRRTPAPRGFSLVEVLIATGLLATVIASIPHLFAIAIRANLDAGDTSFATVLAAQKIEELRAGPFPGPVDRRSGDYLDSEGNRLDDPGATRRAYTRRWRIEPLPSAPANTVVITVVVSRYMSGDGDAFDVAGQGRHAVRLVTLRTTRVP
jgi:prepilin-type N-terminal cleavage/methylation domain-containing protein